MKSIKLTLPTYIIMGVIKIRKYQLNFNNYHTWHFQVRNKLKKMFEASILSQIKQIPPINKIISIKYKIYHKTNRKFDVNNKLVLIDKYLQDVLVNNDIIEDDNYNFIQHTEFQYGGKKEEDYATAEIFYT